MTGAARERMGRSDDLRWFVRVFLPWLVVLATGCDEKCYQIVEDNTRMSGAATYVSTSGDPIQAEAIEDAAAVYFGDGYLRLGWMHGDRLLALTIDRTPEQPGNYDLSSLEARLCECDKERVSPGNCYVDSAQYCLSVGGGLEVRRLSNICEDLCASTIDLTVNASFSDASTQFIASLEVLQLQTLGEHCGRCDGLFCDE